MNPKAFKIAMLHLSQNMEIPEKESPSNKSQDNEKLTLTQRKQVISESLDSYYSPVINAYLRQYDDLGHLMIAAQYAVSKFGDNAIQDFHARLGNIKVKILNAVGDTAIQEKGSLKDKFSQDKTIETMSEEEIDSYVRSELGSIKRDTLTKTKKIQSLLSS